MLESRNEYRLRWQHLFQAGDPVCDGLTSREFWRENLGPQLRTCAAELFRLGENAQKPQPYRQQIR